MVDEDSGISFVATIRRMKIKNPPFKKTIFEWRNGYEVRR